MIPSPDINDPRIAQMLTDVDRVMDMCKNGKMAEPVTDERGDLSYYCKECGHVGTFTLANEDHFEAPKCEQCQSPRTSIGSKKSIVGIYRLKE